MLALATHEPHFFILRELVTFGKQNSAPDKSDAQKLLDAQQIKEMGMASSQNPKNEWVYQTPLQMIKISVLREYLNHEFICFQQIGVLTFEFDFERVIDDFVFLCFFVGNDFLPHMPSMSIVDGAIDFLIEVYKELLPSLGNYLTSPGGNVNLSQLDIVLGKIGEIEDEVFRQRKVSEDNNERRRKSNIKSKEQREKLQSESIRNHSIANNSISTVQDVNRNNNVSNVINTPMFASNRVTLSASTLSTTSNSTASNSTSVMDQMKAMLSETLKKQQVNPVTTPTENKVISVEANNIAANLLRNSILGKRSIPDSKSIDNNIISQEHEIENEKKIMKADGDIDVNNRNTLISEDNGIVKIDNDDIIVDNDDDIIDRGDIDISTNIIVDKTITIGDNENNKQLTPQEIIEAKKVVKERLKAREYADIDKNKETMVDEIKLHESGWKKRYYDDKYKKANIEEGGGLENMFSNYIQGLCWVLKYYYEGCPSWNWYYPFHYAPFASDLINVDKYDIKFELSSPFKAVEQLLAVLPAESKHALPDVCQWLMHEPSSPIADLYNSDVPIDPNGKHMPWMWILLLPFIDEKRVNDAFDRCKDNMTIEEKQRNVVGSSMVFISNNSTLASDINNSIDYVPSTVPKITNKKSKKSKKTIESSDEEDSSFTQSYFFNGINGNGISGTVSQSPVDFYAAIDKGFAAPTVPIGAFDDIKSNQVMCLTYTYPVSAQHESKLLDGVIEAEDQLGSTDLIPRRPPRLNRGGFSMLDVANRNKNSNSSTFNNGMQYNQTQSQIYNNNSQFFNQQQQLQQCQHNYNNQGQHQSPFSHQHIQRHNQPPPPHNQLNQQNRPQQPTYNQPFSHNTNQMQSSNQIQNKFSFNSSQINQSPRPFSHSYNSNPNNNRNFNDNRESSMNQSMQSIRSQLTQTNNGYQQQFRPPPPRREFSPYIMQQKQQMQQQAAPPQHRHQFGHTIDPRTRARPPK
jgi:5'-3' exoribonuclease 2